MEEEWTAKWFQPVFMLANFVTTLFQAKTAFYVYFILHKPVKSLKHQRAVELPHTEYTSF